LFKGRKVLFIMPALSTGGAERVMVTIIKHLNRELFSPTLMVLNRGKNVLDLEDIGCKVDVIDLKVKRARYAPMTLISAIKKADPDTVISTLGYLNEILSIVLPILPKKIHFIARESSVPSLRNKADSKSKLHNFIYRRFMKRFNTIVCQSAEMLEDLNSEYRIPKTQMVVIDNPLDAEYIYRKSKEECLEMNKEAHNILAVGSLKKVKNYNLLIEEATLSSSNNKYWIVGEGEERNNLEALISEKGIEDKVILLGHQNNPWKFMANANEFWQKSHWEGNSNALKEWCLVAKVT
jgi:glycosyltransferase involved in cell wall biosynthesis